ncbi:MAG TPA: alpha/beta hydrolase [Xanthobacteraceae bacterium]|nr:alpha/beta hydrolase [Xanthobacteraceae bacterium]
MTAAETRRIKLWQNRIETEVEISGSGPPLIYLHGPWGLAPDRAFIARLARSHNVFAPKFPGTSSGDPNAVHALDGWHDLVVYGGELLEALALPSPALIGHSFGGLLAAEIAAAAPRAVGRLVLIDPVGLWRDDRPVQNWMLIPDTARKAALFADPGGAAARRFFDVPADPAARVETLSQMIWAQACTGKFVWPIADRGLHRRIHRIAAPTLIVWGDADSIAAPVYAQEFAGRIAGAKVELIEEAGHLPHLEQQERVVAAIAKFLA